MRVKVWLQRDGDVFIPTWLTNHIRDFWVEGEDEGWVVGYYDVADDAAWAFTRLLEADSAVVQYDIVEGDEDNEDAGEGR